MFDRTRPRDPAQVPDPRPADRVVGCVLGLALGDALGAPFELHRAHAIPDPLPALALPWMGLPPGSTTDDTAMAMNLARSLVSQGGFDPEDLVERHLAWLRSDPPDVGNQTRRVLRRVAEGMPAEEAARTVWEERGPEASAGNGSVMYCPPLGVAYANRPRELIELAPRLSSLTHVDERCRTAVLAVTLSVASLVRGDAPSAAARAGLLPALERDGGEELEFLVEEIGRSRPIDGPDQGFCLYAAGAGLQALVRWGDHGDVQAELTRVVGLGGDTDTNAAVAGALLGTAAGAEGLPGDWLERLADRAVVDEAARGLVALAVRH